MEYQCAKVQLKKLMFDNNGLIEPLCNNCQANDCSNPIEIKEISILGITKKYRLYVRCGKESVVVKCEGHTLSDEEPQEI